MHCQGESFENNLSCKLIEEMVLARTFSTILQVFHQNKHGQGQHQVVQSKDDEYIRSEEPVFHISKDSPLHYGNDEMELSDSLDQELERSGGGGTPLRASSTSSLS